MDLPAGHQFLTAVNYNCRNTIGIFVRSCGARGEELRLMSADQCSTLRGEWRVNTEALQVQPRYNIRYKLLCLSFSCLRNTYIILLCEHRGSLETGEHYKILTLSQITNPTAVPTARVDNNAQWMVSTSKCWVKKPLPPAPGPSIIICYHGLSVVSVC